MSYARYRAIIERSEQRERLSLDDLDKTLFDILTNNDLSTEESSSLLEGLLEVVRKNSQAKVSQA